MPTSGSGTGTPVPFGPIAGSSDYISILPDGVELSLTIDRYQELMGLPEAAFNGLEKISDASCYECNEIWKKSDRDALTLAIATAEEMREKELGYYLSPKYTEDEAYQGYDFPLILDHKYLISVGSKAISTLFAGVPPVYRSGGIIQDPVVFTFATTVTDPKEIIITHPGLPVRINPSRIVISGGIANVYVPRSRLVDPRAECDTVPSYEDDSVFLTSVDIKRQYTDVTDGAYAVWSNMQIDNCSVGSGRSFPGESTQKLYAHIDNRRLAIVKLFPATESGGIWTSSRFSKCHESDFIRISYLSGRTSSTQTELDTARLSHTVLPTFMPSRLSLCSCWTPDLVQNDDGVITPYGTMVGAVTAWMADSRAKVGVGGKFPRIKL